MTTFGIISLSALVFALIYYAFDCAKSAKKTANLNKELEIVQDIPIGHTIYDLFPEWRKEFESDPLMDEIAATCDLYLAAKELLNDGTADIKRIVQLSDAVSKFEKYAL